MHAKIQNILYNLFIVWTGAGLLTLAAGRFVLPSHLVWADALFMALAAANVLCALARRDGWRTALWSFGILTAGSGLASAIGALTGWPFGPFEFTPFFGPRLGGLLPVAAPLAWFAVMASGHYLLSHGLQRWSRNLLALLVGAWTAAFDFAFEPFAAFVKDYWLWNASSIPVGTYAAWFVLACLLVRLAPWGRAPAGKFDPRPAVVVASLLLLIAMGRLRAGV